MGESQAQLLGGHFALMMLVEINSSEVESLNAVLQKEVVGMSTSCFDAVGPEEKVEMRSKIGCECILMFLNVFAMYTSIHIFFVDNIY